MFISTTGSFITLRLRLYVGQGKVYWLFESQNSVSQSACRRLLRVFQLSSYHLNNHGLYDTTVYNVNLACAPKQGAKREQQWLCGQARPCYIRRLDLA
jgi:hypothetical protein